MEQVFAPWRIDWVEREAAEDAGDECALCALPERGDDHEHRIVARNEEAYVMLNNYPYNPGHSMVIPYAHTGAYHRLDEAVLLAHARLLQRTIEAVETALDPDAYNTGMNLGGSAAGGSIPDHLHTHVVPRWEGDTNFMPVVSDTKVIVEAVDDTRDRLRAAFAEQDGARVEGETAAVRFD